MPVNVVHNAEEEALWNKAKEIVASEHGSVDNRWALVNHIYQSLKHKGKAMSKASQPLIDGLKKILDATHLLYLKTHEAHWNVTGPLFPQLHGLFGEQYDDLHGATDELAERLRQIQVPAFYPPFAGDGYPVDVSGLVCALKCQHEALTALCSEVSKFAEAEGDQGTIDLLGRRMAAHEKAAWMLRSILETPDAPVPPTVDVAPVVTSWVPMSMGFGETLWAHGIVKAVSRNDLGGGVEVMSLPHTWETMAKAEWTGKSMEKAGTGQPKPGAKYIKRVPTGNPRRPWKYFYAVQHGGGVANKEHMVEGASFKHGDGHFHIHGVKDGKLIVSHGEGEKKHMTHEELASKLTEHHGKAIAEHKEKLLGEIEDARKAGNVKAVERLTAEAKNAGYVTDDTVIGHTIERSPNGPIIVPVTEGQRKKKGFDRKVFTKADADAKVAELKESSRKTQEVTDAHRAKSAKIIDADIVQAKAEKKHADERDRAASHAILERVTRQSPSSQYHSDMADTHAEKAREAKLAGDTEAMKMHVRARDAHGYASQIVDNPARKYTEEDKAKAQSAAREATSRALGTDKPMVAPEANVPTENEAPEHPDKWSGGAIRTDAQLEADGYVKGADGAWTKKDQPSKNHEPTKPAKGESDVPTTKVEHSIPNSKNLERVSWEPAKPGEGHGVMRVHFKNGSAYDYKDVPHDHYKNIVDAGSPGEAFNGRVKGKYESTKIRAAGTDGGSRADGPVRTPTKILDEQAAERKVKAAEKQKQSHDFVKERDEVRAKVAEVAKEPEKAEEAAKPSHADLVNNAKKTYGFTDAEAEKVHARSLKHGADKHVAEGRHEEAQNAVKQAVKEHLTLSRERGLSPSKAHKYMESHEAAEAKKGMKKAFGEAFLSLAAMFSGK